MTLKPLFLILLSCTFCAGQSALPNPENQAQPQPQQDSTTLPISGAVPAPIQMPYQVGAKVYGIQTGAELPPTQALSPASPRVVGPLIQRTEFQKFAEDATGHRLPVYGRKLFDEVPTTFSPVENIPVPADYVLGPGDELLIRAWGKIDLDVHATVDRNGQIYLPQVGTLSVAGLRYDQVEKYLRSAIGSLYKDFELNVALGQLRSIQIFILGNARQPGAYTVGSLSTLVDALFASGGPSATGTMRHIQLLRGKRVVTDFDIYDLVEKGDMSHDVQLLPGDVIFIPPIGPQIAISGNVNQPGIYELKGETAVASALQDAGGLTSLAEAQRVLLERIDSHSSRQVEEFALDASGLQRPLKDGDVLRIYPLSPEFENAVTLRGNVAQPGRYAWKEGMRVSDLIPSREFLITRDFWNRQNYEVRSSNSHEFGVPGTDSYGTPLEDQGAGYFANQDNGWRTDQNGNQPTDRIADSGAGYESNGSADQFGNERTGQPANERTDQNMNPRTGRFGNPGTEQNRNLMNTQVEGPQPSLIDTVGKNSAEINWDYAVIERLDKRDLSTRLIPFNLANALDDHASQDDEALKPGDVVIIFSRADIDLPMEEHASFVRVGGEVNSPGVYRVKPGQTLRDVVREAGGLTPHSYLYASVFTRVSTRKAQEEQLRQSTEEMQREISSRFANATPQAGQTGSDEQAQAALQQAALAKLTSIRPAGRIVLEMKPDATTADDIPAFPLEDGDALYIPPRPSTVEVIGAVYNTNAFRYEEGKRLMAYLNDAGGPTREADQKRIFVIRADGSVISRQSHGIHSHGSFEGLRLLPGDAVVVPEKFRVGSKVNDFLQATQFASQAALAAAALSVIK